MLYESFQWEERPSRKLVSSSTLHTRLGRDPGPGQMVSSSMFTVWTVDGTVKYQEYFHAVMRMIITETDLFLPSPRTLQQLDLNSSWSSSAQNLIVFLILF